MASLGDGTFLGFPNQLLFLASIVGSLLTAVLFMWQVIWNNQSKKVDGLAEKMDEMITVMTKMVEKVDRLEKDSITGHEVKDITRREVQEFYLMMERMKKQT